MPLPVASPQADNAIWPVGEVTIGDMGARYGRQVQPEGHVPFHLPAIQADAFVALDGVKLDHHHGCAYGAPLFVPHNQRIVSGGATVADNDGFLRTGLPATRWDLTALTNVDFQCFPDAHHAHQVLDAHAIDESVASTAAMTATCTTLLDAAGTEGDLNAQEVRLFLSRSIFPRLGSTDSTVAVKVTIGGYVFTLDLSSSRLARILRSDDGGTTQKVVKSDVKGSGNDARLQAGQTTLSASEMVELRILVMNGRVSISLGGAAPVVVPLTRTTRGAVVSRSGATLTLSPGEVDRLPPVPFSAHVWDLGAPRAGRLTLVSVTAKNAGADQVTVTGLPSEAATGWHIDVLDPRITKVVVTATGFTHFSWAMHATRWAALPTITPPPFQIGYTPDVASVYRYLVISTTDVQRVSDGTYDAPLLAATAGLSHTVDGQTISVTAAIENPENTVGGYRSYLGQAYADETLALVRIVATIDGIVDEPTGSQTTLYLGRGSDNHHIAGFSEDKQFDPGGLTITSSATVTFDITSIDVDTLRGLTGVGLFGNIAVGLRLGFEHQADWDTLGNLGVARFAGYSPERQVSVSIGNKTYLTLVCVDRMEQLRRTLAAAPPNMDGWNHYAAVAWWAGWAGIPRDQLGFADMVPDDPFDYAVADTDPYFMPIGIGMNPATPVNRIVSPLDQLGQVRRLTGNVMYFDADDKLQYVPWMQDLGASTAARTFQAYDGRDLDGGLLGTSALALTTSVRNVINQLLLVGIDAYDSWVPIVEKREDADSIWAAPGSQPVNYVGFRAPGVQMDPRFADRGFSRRSADLMFAWLRQPEVTVPVSPGWPQFDLFPLAQIRVREWHTRLEELPLFIMSISNRVSRAGANWQFGCSIQSRYLDPDLLGIAAADLATFDRDDTEGFDSDDGSWSFDQA